jgi:hypothetical protein
VLGMSFDWSCALLAICQLEIFCRGFWGKTYDITPNPDSACYVVVFGNEFDGAVLGVDFFLRCSSRPST